MNSRATILKISTLSQLQLYLVSTWYLRKINKLIDNENLQGIKFNNLFDEILKLFGTCVVWEDWH